MLPPHLIAKGDEARVARDWSCAAFPLNSMLSNPPVQYETMGDLLRILCPGAYMGGVDPQDCFLHWMVAPSRRRYLGVRHPLTGVLGVYLFLLSGLGPFPGWNDCCVKAVLGVARPRYPEMHMVDFAEDIRLADAPGQHGALAAGVTGHMSLLGQMGARYRAKEGKRWWPTRRIPWLGFEVDTQTTSPVWKIAGSKKAPGCVRGSSSPARGRPRRLEMNFLRWVVPGGSCHLRSGRNAVSESGVMELWRTGGRRASALAAISEGLRNDMVWWRKMLSTRPAKRLQFGDSGGFVWRPRLPILRQLAMSPGESPVVAVYTGAPSLQGWGAALGDHYIQGKWSKLERREGINWKEL